MKIRGAILYTLLVLPFLLIPVAFLPFGQMNVGLSVSLLAVIIAGGFATLYIRLVYRQTERTVFFDMLMAAVELKYAFAAWIGYLLAANLLRPDINLPVPSQEARVLINSVVAVVLLSSQLYYAATIYLERRQGRR